MSDFYEIKPLDTLFFRGSTPMEAGQYNTISMFPPPVSVIKGAFWTEYHKEDKSYGTTIPFDVSSILIKKICSDGKPRFYVPAPATWYYDSEDKVSSGEKFENVKICTASFKKELSNFKAMSSAVVSENESDAEDKNDFSADRIVFVKPENDAKPLANCWIDLEFVKNPQKKFGKYSVLCPGDVYSSESRTGNALSKDRQVIDGKLYTSTHIRLNDGISIIAGLYNDPDFGNGNFTFGGEKRISSFTKLNEELSFGENGFQFLSLIPIEATEDNLKKLLASGKITVTAGWDLNKGFHKSSTSWIPAGAVFDEKLDGTIGIKSDS